MFLPPDGKRTVIGVRFQEHGNSTLVTLFKPKQGTTKSGQAYEERVSRAWEVAFESPKEVL
ncbi:MAG: hypothetical protein D6791_02900 [Chloroflexi bacterium]|nr:MAG: hypothetical protein D6791_02900 [Chloroflexota bacterium]